MTGCFSVIHTDNGPSFLYIVYGVACYVVYRKQSLVVHCTCKEKATTLFQH